MEIHNNQSYPYSFDNYYWGNDLSIKEEILELFENQFQTVDCVIINSEVGIGGTHLLYAMYKKIGEDNFYNGEDFGHLIKGQKEVFETLMLHKYLFIDDFHALYKNEKLDDSLFHFLKEFIEKGGKLFIKSNNNFRSLVEKSFTDFSSKVINLQYEKAVSVQMLDAICTELNDHTNHLFQNKVITDAIKACDFNNYRVLQGFIISIIARNLKTEEEIRSLYNQMLDK